MKIDDLKDHIYTPTPLRGNVGIYNFNVMCHFVNRCSFSRKQKVLVVGANWGQEVQMLAGHFGEITICETWKSGDAKDQYIVDANKANYLKNVASVYPEIDTLTVNESLSRLQDDDFDVVIIDNRFDTIPASDLDMIVDLINERGVVHPICAIFLRDQAPDAQWWLQGWTTPILIGDMAMLFSEKTYS